MPTIEERDAENKAFREKLKAAKSILCIGAGPTGLETAAYMKEEWKDKKIGVCQRSKTMMPMFEGMHELILEELKKLEVEYHPDTDFKEGEGIAKDYEVHIDCRGMKFDGPAKYLKNELAECIDPKTGQIWVNH